MKATTMTLLEPNANHNIKNLTQRTSMIIEVFLQKINTFSVQCMQMLTTEESIIQITDALVLFQFKYKEECLLFSKFYSSTKLGEGLDYIIIQRVMMASGNDDKQNWPRVNILP